MKKNFVYVDAFVVPLPRKNMKTYLKWAKLAGKVWKEHGAIDYVECKADDVRKGKVTSFPRSVKLKKGELVVFSWITYKSKTQRNQVMKKVMSDPRLAQLMNEDTVPFDGMRVIWGGFKPVVKL